MLETALISPVLLPVKIQFQCIWKKKSLIKGEMKKSVEKSGVSLKIKLGTF